jgi:hypothetical protein
MVRLRHSLRALAALAMTAALLSDAQSSLGVEVHMRLAIAKNAARRTAPPAVLWLMPLQKTPPAPFPPGQKYTLMQKNRTFKPHLLVVPVGSVVQFPNADPFFHNVFSLFDGKRFDLGLYEAGSTKSVTFSREGISYIFCNIHPEMSAVVIALSTSIYDIGDSRGIFHVSDVPPGDYEMHVWIEGVAQPALNSMTRRVHLTSNSGDLGTIEVPANELNSKAHTNMYDQPYDRDVKPY